MNTSILPSFAHRGATLLPSNIFEVGETHNGVASYDSNVDKNLFITGRVGSGSSLILSDIVEHAVASGWELSVIDLRNELSDYSDKVNVVSTPKNALSLLKEIGSSLKGNGKTETNRLLILNEIADLASNTAVWSEARRLIERIAKADNVNVIVSTYAHQLDKYKTFLSKRKGFQTRIVMGFVDDIRSNQLRLGYGNPHTVAKSVAKGRGYIYKQGSQPVEFQAYLPNR